MNKVSNWSINSVIVAVP